MKPINVGQFPGRTIETEEGTWLYFGGTAYLGLQGDQAFQDILVGNIRRYGASYGASRQSNVRFAVYGEAESELAQRAGCEDAVVLSSGYLAGQLVCQFFKDSGCELIHVPGTHPALRVEKSNTAIVEDHDLERAVWRCLESGKPPVLLLDSIDFRGRHFPDFECLKKLPLGRLTLVVDDSHGFGVTGANGEGSMEALRGLRPKELVVCGSLNKGLAIQAGVVLGTNDRIGQLRDTAFFAGASPPAPASLATFLEAKALYRDKHRALVSKVSLFAALNQLNPRLCHNAGHPAFTIVDAALATRLEDAGILVTNFRYPNRWGPLVSRLVISAAHTFDDIEALSKGLGREG